jgi:hypothetical protein
MRKIIGDISDWPDKTIVICVEKKVKKGAMDRTQPLLPMNLG